MKRITHVAHREVQCGNKVRFGTQHLAALMALKLNLLATTKLRTKVEPYICPFCDSYHIGNQPAVAVSA